MGKIKSFLNTEKYTVKCKVKGKLDKNVDNKGRTFFKWW
jgi:hypothetical protein